MINQQLMAIAINEISSFNIGRKFELNELKMWSQVKQPTVFGRYFKSNMPSIVRHNNTDGDNHNWYERV